MKTIYYNPIMIKEQTKITFNQWYNEFKNFISEQNLPQFELKFYYSKEKCTTVCEHPDDPITGVHTIVVNELLLQTHGLNAKSIAFHEFTHIYDQAYFFKLFINK